jgi:pimeloyl-ACP methyl ester carboxylesterase
MMEIIQQRVTLPSGISLHVYQAGTGPDVLLLHGITGCGTYWSVQMAQLVAAGYRVTAPDGRGHGQSDRANDYATATIAGDAAALIEQLGLERPVVVGHSMGGAQSLMLACTYPELVSKVILEDPAIWPINGDTAYVRERREPWEQSLRQWLTMSQADLVAFKRSEVPHWSEEALQNWAYAKLHNDPLVLQWLDELLVPVWAWLTPVAVPMHILYCAPDRGGVVQEIFVEALIAHMPQLTAEVIADAGHEIHHDQPEAFMRAVLGFIKSA